MAASVRNTRTGDRVRIAVAVLLLALVALSLSLGDLSPTAYGGWPAPGILALYYFVGRPAWRRWQIVAAVLVVGTILHIRVGVPLAGAFPAALVPVLAPWLTIHLIHPAGRRRTGLDTFEDEKRYASVVFLSALLCGLGAMGLSMLSGWYSVSESALTGVLTLLSSASAQFVFLPLTLRRSREPADAPPVERWIQRTMVATALAVTFGPVQLPSAAFILAPLLAFCAIRLTRLESYVQSIVAMLIAYACTLGGVGPFTADSPNGRGPVLFFVFVLCSMQLVVPVATTINRLKALARHDAQSQHTVDQLLAAATTSVILVTDPIGRIARFNSGAERLLGYTEEEVLGRRTEFLLSASEIDRHARHFGVPSDLDSIWLAISESGEPRDMEFIRKDGETTVGAVHLTPITDQATGAVRGYLGLAEDVSDRQRTHQALTQALRHEQQAVSKLVEADRVKQELVSNVSHELRTPVTSIVGYAELLMDDQDTLSEQQQGAVNRIVRNAQRLRVLVENLLTLSRAQAGSLELAREPVDLVTVVGGAAELLGGLLRHRDLRYQINLPDEPVLVPGDAEALDRVVVNLVSNAVKFTPDGGSITIRVDTLDGHARMTIADTGIGISVEEQSQLFTRFFRSAAATENAIQGTGIGLNLVQQIVTAHDGSVEIESTPGEGTSVHVVLPLFDAPKTVETSGESGVAPLEAAEPVDEELRSTYPRRPRHTTDQVSRSGT